MDSPGAGQASLMSRVLRRRTETKEGLSPQRDNFSDTASVSSQRSISPKYSAGGALCMNLISEYQTIRYPIGVTFRSNTTTVIALDAKMCKPTSDAIAKRKLNRDSTDVAKSAPNLKKLSKASKDKLFLKPWSNPRSQKHFRSSEEACEQEFKSSKNSFDMLEMSDILQRKRCLGMNNLVNEKDDTPITKKKKLVLDSAPISLDVSEFNRSPMLAIDFRISLLSDNTSTQKELNYTDSSANSTQHSEQQISVPISSFKPFYDSHTASTGPSQMQSNLTNKEQFTLSGVAPSHNHETSRIKDSAISDTICLDNSQTSKGCETGNVDCSNFEHEATSALLIKDVGKPELLDNKVPSSSAFQNGALDNLNCSKVLAAKVRSINSVSIKTSTSSSLTATEINSLVDKYETKDNSKSWDMTENLKEKQHFDASDQHASEVKCDNVAKYHTVEKSSKEGVDHKTHLELHTYFASSVDKMHQESSNYEIIPKQPLNESEKIAVVPVEKELNIFSLDGPESGANFIDASLAKTNLSNIPPPGPMLPNFILPNATTSNTAEEDTDKYEQALAKATTSNNSTADIVVFDTEETIPVCSESTDDICKLNSINFENISQLSSNSHHTSKQSESIGPKCLPNHSTDVNIANVAEFGAKPSLLAKPQNVSEATNHQSNVLADGVSSNKSVPSSLPNTPQSSSSSIENENHDLSADLINNSKLVTEVCACDTTTGSNGDETVQSKANVQSFATQNVDMSSNNYASSPTESPKTNKELTGFRRREWAKQLTKIRMKIQMKKRLKKEARLKKALLTRAASSKHRRKSQPLDPSNGEHTSPDVKGVESVDESKSNESAVKNKGASATHSDIDDIAHSVDIEPAQDACSIVNDSKASKDFSSSTYLGDIEIVEDDDDDEDEPWPFTASPLSSTENEFVEKTDVSSVLENSNLNTDNVSVSKSMKTVLTANEIESGELHVINSAQDDLQDTDKAVERTLFERSLPHQNASETSLQKYKHSALAMAPPAKSATGSSSNSTLKSVSKGSKSPWHDPPVSVSPKKVDGDLYQPARMQSRMAEPNLNESITESMWKDMFNSEVVPLDFNEMPAVRKSPKKQQKLLAVYKSSVVRVSQCSRERDTCVSVSNYINTPSGDSYPVTDAPRIQPLTADNFKLCSCKSEGLISPTKEKLRIMFCQAVDTIDNAAVNCMHKVTDKVELRASARLPLMILCKFHRKKLNQHTSCPMCGQFCTRGTFVDCTGGKGHLHHVSCQIQAKDGTYVCPHCGEKSQQVTQVRDCKRKWKKPSKKEGEGLARMCIRLVSKPAGSSSEENVTYESKLFEVQKPKLLDGSERTKLINIMSAIHHLRPAMQDKLNSAMTSTTLYDLSSYILKNDLSQLALGVCDILGGCRHSKEKFPLDKQFAEQGGKSLLHLSVQSNSLAIVHCLVMAGAALNTPDHKGVSPLMLAAKGNQLDILKYLIGAGAMTDWRDVDGMTPLHMAAVAGHRDICEYLLNQHHANVDCVDEGGWTPLVWAIENGHTHVVKALLSADADIHVRDSEGNASIHWGAYSGNTDIIKLLVNRGADVEAVNELGDRPLHIAVRQARTEAVILLLSHGVDTSAVNNLFQTAAECCHGACSENMKSFLLVNDILRSCKVDGISSKPAKLLHRDIARGKEKVPIPVVNDADDCNYPTDFTYVTESVFTSHVPVNTTINSLNRCSCSGDCTRGSCACARASIACWYDGGGVLSSDFDFVSPPRIFECNKACGCWNTCTNRVVQHGISVQMELFKTAHRGWGVKSRHKIAKGTFVCEYVGELITDSQADEREDDSYLFDLDYKDGDTFCMDAKHYGNISRFINHRCEPNLTPVSVFVDHQDLRFPRICLFANTDIPAGTELGFDYGEKFWLVKYKHFLCDCGCNNCKYNKSSIDSTLALHMAATGTPPSSASSNPHS